MSASVKRSSRSPTTPSAGAGTVEHHLLQGGNALLLEQSVVGQAHLEAGLELVHDPDLGQRIPPLHGPRPVVLAHLDTPPEHLLEDLLEGIVEFLAHAHCCSAM